MTSSPISGVISPRNTCEPILRNGLVVSIPYQRQRAQMTCPASAWNAVGPLQGGRPTMS
jgi:hypothetical protein